jgi:hypothetical protein
MGGDGLQNVSLRGMSSKLMVSICAYLDLLRGLEGSCYTAGVEGRSSLVVSM